MTREEIYEKMTGVRHPNCPTPSCDDCPLNGNGCHTDAWWNTDVDTKMFNDEKTITSTKLIETLTKMFRADLSVDYASGISACIQAIRELDVEE
jgi:hypothetical protein